MDGHEELTDIRGHGAAIDKERRRIQCNYCGKVVSGFNRLRYHLGGVRGDVVPCVKVPADVKTAFNDLIIGRKSQALKREAAQVSGRSTTRQWGAGLDPSEVGKRRKIGEGSYFGQVGGVDGLFAMPVANGGLNGDVGGKEKASRRLLRCIGEFFGESGLDFEVADSPSFKRMFEVAMEVGRGHNAPTSGELKECMARGEDDEVVEHVNMVKSSWGMTGCSILLDSWLDENGRIILVFLADSSQGTIFIKSVDVSDSITDVDKLFLLIDEVIEEVGADNVVQVVTYRVSHIMEGVGKKITEKRRKIFWTVCASHCIGLILENFKNMAHVVDVLDKAKSITRFVYGNPLILAMMERYTLGKELIRMSTVKSASPFLTLEVIVSENESLISMFESEEWKSSVWASGREGKKVAKLVQNHQFWSASEDSLNAAIPLVCVIRLINGDRNPSIGYIYETMDQAKEKVKKNFGNVQTKYEPLWEVIDDIWDNRLHSPLHCAGYFLNPVLFYADDFFADAEVASGLLCCIVRMADDRSTQDRIVKQLEEYRSASGNFGQDIAIEKRRQLLPAQWWSAFGGHCPDLQKLAIRILSQTCCGASRFGLRRRIVPETVHPTGVNGLEQRKTSHSEYLHCNLLLKDHLSLSAEQKDVVLFHEHGQMTDWLGEAQTQASANGHLEHKTDADRQIKTHTNDSSDRLSADQVKVELT